MSDFGILGRRARQAFVLISGLVSWAVAWGQSGPAWEFEAEEHDVVVFENTEWHAKDFGWLMTCRIRVKSSVLVKHVTQVVFEGYAEKDGEEVIWSKEKVVRRKDFTSAYGGGDEQFLRVLFKEVPADVAFIKMRFDNGDEEDAE